MSSHPVRESYTLTVESSDLTHLNDHFPTAEVSLVNFPETVLTTAAFNITVRLNCEEDVFSSY